MTAAAVEPDNDAGSDDFALAWYQHAAAVEGKLENLSRIMAGTAEDIRRQGDPSRWPDPFALAALQCASRTEGQGSPAEFLRFADEFEAWLRRPRGEAS
jgi:hypothetical protein